MSKWVAAIAGLVAAVVFAPLAHADDATFINTLQRDGLSCGQGLIRCAQPADLIPVAESLCGNLDQGDSRATAIGKLTPIAAIDHPIHALVTGNPLLEFAVLATSTYCPQYRFGA